MAVIEPGSEELAAAFARVAAVLSDGLTVDEVLARIASLAVTTIDACDLAGVIVRDGDRAITVAVSDELVRELERLQIDAAEGPCLEVLAGAPAVYATDFAAGDDWPQISSRMVALGVRSDFAIRLGRDDPLGALNLYAYLPDAYGATDRAQASIFATQATVALLYRRQQDRDAVLADQLRQGLATRNMIGQAQGILMERDRISADQAFDVLRRASQHLNVKLRDVAQRLVDTGEDPETGPPR